MGKTGIEKRAGTNSLDKVQYTIAFGIVGVLLYLIGFPVFLLFFFGLVAYFFWKMFAQDLRSDTRGIFEFYLRSNEILRQDGRRWYGFEIREAIRDGNAIAARMGTVPPLLDFCLGALHHKIGDHKQALDHFESLEAKPDRDEANIVFPSKELREYVRILRKIERAPAEAPLTASAIRALERMRKNQGSSLMEESKEAAEQKSIEGARIAEPQSLGAVPAGDNSHYLEEPSTEVGSSKARSTASGGNGDNDRKTISEVLHDIYDTNIH